MVNKKVVMVGLIATIVMLAVVLNTSTRDPVQAKEISVINTKSPPEVPTTIGTLELSGDSVSITCQQPSKDNKYGGIGGSENNPPRGTEIDSKLTIKYNRPTATGVCGTYWYIAGWWFNASEMAKLPQETIMYGMSPYAITTGSDNAARTGNGGNDGSNNGNDGSNNGNDGSNSGNGGSNNGNDGSNNGNDGSNNGNDDGDDPIVPVPEVATIVMVILGMFALVVLNKTNK